MGYIRQTLTVALVLCCTLAQAEKADKNKPIHIESDTLRFDDRQQVGVFTGNVVFTKGSIIIRGSQITVREDSKGNQFGVATASPGKLAFFRQKREGVDEFIEGEAELIEYDGEKDLVRFTRQAVMRRLRGAQLADEAVGAVIQYDNTTDVFTVDGGAAQGKAAATGRGRVRVMLTPKPENNLPASAAPAAIATPLKITPTLKERP